jgi:hypothetical protein
MIINFNYAGNCICELQIKLGQGFPRGYDEQHFLYNCRRTIKAKDVGILCDCMIERANTFIYENRVLLEGELLETDPVEGSLQALLTKEGHDVKNFIQL